MRCSPASGCGKRAPERNRPPLVQSDLDGLSKECERLKEDELGVPEIRIVKGPGHLDP